MGKSGESATRAAPSYPNYRTECPDRQDAPVACRCCGGGSCCFSDHGTNTCRVVDAGRRGSPTFHFCQLRCADRRFDCVPTRCRRQHCVVTPQCYPVPSWHRQRDVAAAIDRTGRIRPWSAHEGRPEGSGTKAHSYLACVQLSENASAQVLNGRPSRLRGQALPTAFFPLMENEASSAGTNTVQRP